MTRFPSLAALALISVGAAVNTAEAQTHVSPAVIAAAQSVVGTATVLGTRVFADSVVVTIEDPGVSSMMAGGWKFGGLDGTPRAVGRTIAEAIRSALPTESRADFIVLNVAGPAPAPSEEPVLSGTIRITSVRLPYTFPASASR